jgi:HEAT repeat protein
LAPFLLLEATLSQEGWIRLCTNPLFVMAALLMCIGGPVALLKPSRKAREAARRLSTLEDVAAIGGLVETLSFGHDTRVDTPAREALIRLLTQLKASDAGLLKDGHLALLRSTLASSGIGSGDLFTSLSHRQADHARLQVAILKAFEQVGDSQSLPVVTHLAKSAGNLGVRKAAAECLPFLIARVEQQRASQTLLRAASASGTGADTLLRPVSAAYQQAPNEMLRQGMAPEIAGTVPPAYHG